MEVKERLKLYKKLHKTDEEIYHYLQGVIYRAEKKKDHKTIARWHKEMEKYRIKVYKKKK